MNEFRFTFVRGAPEREELRQCLDADNIEDAMQQAELFCKVHACQIAHLEWFDDEIKRWQNSVVQYA
jgi:hypothetical protein